jgi:TolB protein
MFVRLIASLAAALILQAAPVQVPSPAPAANPLPTGQQPVGRQLPPPGATAQIDINQGVAAPLPIAIAAFSGPGQHSDDIPAIIRNNLDRSGVFSSIDPARFIDRTVEGTATPNFPNWKLVQAQYLVTGQVYAETDGRVRVDFRLWDVNLQQQLLGLTFVASAENWRRVGHKISDAVYQRLTGEPGYFDTRIAFVAESGPKTARKQVLGLMDQDGANPQFLTPGDEMIFSPRFSAHSQDLAYMALRPEGSQIYLYNLETARRETLGHYPGMVFAPRFSPDGTKVAFSVERGGNSDVYTVNLASRASTRITTDPGIDTSPSFSPDGSQIVFNSDRAGSPQLYLMNADGSNQRRLSTGAGRYTGPVWSPRGDYIAFTKQTGNTFHIGIMRPDGSGERILTTSFYDDGPTWAPNGRILMFYRATSGADPHLWTVDLNGRTLLAPYLGAASEPAWSPLLD